MTAKELIEQAGSRGRIFTVDFIKRPNGQARRINGRLSRVMKLGKTGAGMRYNPLAHNLVGVLDLDVYKANLGDGRDKDTAAAAAFRHVPLEGVLAVNSEPIGSV